MQLSSLSMFDQRTKGESQKQRLQIKKVIIYIQLCAFKYFKFAIDNGASSSYANK
jgi:hypothetical protein